MNPAAANTARYFWSADRRTQCLIDVTDQLHRMVWGVASFGNRRWPDAELVTPADPLEWLESQLAVRLGADNAAYRIGKVRAADAQVAA